MSQIVVILMPLIAMSMLLPRIIRDGPSSKGKMFIWGMFVAYILCYLYITVFSRHIGYGRNVELCPFNVYGHLFDVPSAEDSMPTGIVEIFTNATPPIVGVILNVLLYYPLGYLLSLLFPCYHWKRIIFIGFFCSVSTEAIQYFFKLGWCETDDVIHNTIGTAIGAWVWHRQAYH